MNNDDDFLFLDDDDVQPKEMAVPKIESVKESPTVVRSLKSDVGVGTVSGEVSKSVNPRSRVTHQGGMRPNKPVVNVGQEEILVQGPTYKSEEKVTGATQNGVESGQSDGTGPRRKVSLSPKLLVGLIGGAVLLLIVIISVAYINKAAIEKQKAEEERRLAEIMNEESTENYFKYSRDEVEELRLAGYTGYEIEEFELNGVSAESKVKEAEQARKAKYDAEILPYFDEASDAYKNLLNSTWLGQKTFNISSEFSTYQNGSTVLNLDYEKVGCYGMQCWLKVYIDEDTTFFVFVTPKRYTELNDSGNIVVSVEFTNVGDEQKSIITDWSEIRN